MSSSLCTCAESYPLLSSERTFSDGTAIRSTDVSVRCLNVGDRVMAQRLVVPVGSGEVPYSDESIVAVNSSVRLLNCCFRLVNGATAQDVSIYLYKKGSSGTKYFYCRSVYLSANGSEVIDVGKVDAVDLFANGSYNQVYVAFYSGYALAVFDFYCNVVVDD